MLFVPILVKQIPISNSDHFVKIGMKLIHFHNLFGKFKKRRGELLSEVLRCVVDKSWGFRMVVKLFISIRWMVNKLFWFHLLGQKSVKSRSILVDHYSKGIGFSFQINCISLFLASPPSCFGFQFEKVWSCLFCYLRLHQYIIFQSQSVLSSSHFQVGVVWFGPVTWCHLIYPSCCLHALNCQSINSMCCRLQLWSTLCQPCVWSRRTYAHK